MDALAQVLALEPVSFIYNEGDGRVRYGFIAEDTAAIVEHLATHDASGTVSGELANFTSPLLMMMPDRSPFVSLSQVSALVELVPQTEVAIFPEARHGLPFSHAKEAAGALLGFLERVESGHLFPPRGEA